MKVVLFGASGMIGQGVLRECVLDSDVERVLVVGRSSIGPQGPKVREVVHKDLANLAAIDGELAGYDACFFCLGISSAGMNEEEYRRITYDIAVEAGRVLAKHSPAITFVFVSGQGTDSTEKGASMWARVKGQAENALLARLPKAVMFRPGFIQPLHGIKSRTRMYRMAYTVLAPVVPALRKLFPKHVLTTEQIGRAMLQVARSGAPKRVLEAPDIAALAP